MTVQMNVMQSNISLHSFHCIMLLRSMCTYTSVDKCMLVCACVCVLHALACIYVPLFLHSSVQLVCTYE